MGHVGTVFTFNYFYISHLSPSFLLSCVNGYERSSQEQVLFELGHVQGRSRLCTNLLVISESVIHLFFSQKFSGFHWRRRNPSGFCSTFYQGHKSDSSGFTTPASLPQHTEFGCSFRLCLMFNTSPVASGRREAGNRSRFVSASPRGRLTWLVPTCAPPSAVGRRRAEAFDKPTLLLVCSEVSVLLLLH
ncbi:uncharacterized [Tachysurus ichikawai]